MARRNRHIGTRIAGLAVAGSLAAFALPTYALAGGGTSVPTPGEPSTPPDAPVKKARYVKSTGDALAPIGAPQAVIDAIAAANAINDMAYVWGGGHNSSFSPGTLRTASRKKKGRKGYDCSGAVSYVLGSPGARLISYPMVSGDFARWGKRGRGRWITVYANGGHVFTVIAKLRFDTSAYGSGGNGPRWRTTKRPMGGFAVRNPRQASL